MGASSVSIEILAGKTFELALFVSTSDKVMKAISGVVAVAPVTLTVPSHGLVDDWLVTISGVVKPTQLNTGGADCSSSLRNSYAGTAAPYRVKVVDSDTIELVGVNGASWPTYTTGGIVEFYAPADLTDVEARAQFRKHISAETPILTFLSSGLPDYDPAGAVAIVDNTNSTVTLSLPASVAEELQAGTGVWDAEYITADGDVYPLVAVSKYTIKGEVTR